MKFAGGDDYHEQIKWLHFVQIWNRNKGTGYERKFESTSISFAAMTPHEWIRTFTAQTTADAIAGTFSSLKDFI